MVVCVAVKLSTTKQNNMSRRMVSQVEEGRTIMVVNSKGGDGDERIQVLNGVYPSAQRMVRPAIPSLCRLKQRLRTPFSSLIHTSSHTLGPLCLSFGN